MHGWLTSFAAGAGIGLAVAMPIGPMGLLCIQRTLSSGWRAGVTTGMGAATVHTIFGSVAALGFGAALAALIDGRNPALMLLSATVLFWFAARLLGRGIGPGPSSDPDTGGVRSYTSAVALGLSNPLTLLLFAAALPVLASERGTEGAVVLVAGVFAGSISWWLVLTILVASVRSRLPTRMLALTNRVSGVALAGLGGLTCASAFGMGLP